MPPKISLNNLSALMANAFGKGAGSLPRDIYKPRIACDLVEHGQDALRFRHKAAVEIGFKLQQGVIDSQPVVLHAACNQVYVLLLARQPFKNLQELSRRRIQSVIEFCLMD